MRRLREHVDRSHRPQLVAGVDHLARVGRQRGGVAGHVDDPLGLRPRARAAPPSATGPRAAGRPPRRRPCPPPRSAGAWRCARRRRRSGRCRCRSAGVLDRVGHGALHQLHAHDLARPPAPARARSCRCRSRGRTPARAPREPRQLAPPWRRGARPSRCWSGRTRRVRSGSAARCRRAQLLLDRGRSRERLGLAAAGGLGHARRSGSRARCRAGSAAASSSLRKSPRLVTSRAWSWPGAPALAHHEVAQEALVVVAVIGRQALLAAPGRARPRAARRRARRPARRRSTVVDHVPAAGAVEAQQSARRRRPRRRSTPPCCGSAAARRPGTIGSTGGSSKPPEARQRVAHLALLLLQLALVGQHLPRRARVGRGAARSGRGWAPAISTARGLGERALGLLDRGPARGRPGTAPRTNTTKPSVAADAGAAVGERVDRDLDLLPPTRARRAWLWRSRASGLCSQAPVPIDLAAYRAEAEEFLSSIDREYYLHYSGQQDEFEIEPIYDRHAALFSREAVDELREARRPGAAAGVRRAGPDRPRDQGGRRPSWRAARPRSSWTGTASRCPTAPPPCAQANEPDPDRRAELEDRAQRAAGRAELNPLLARAARALARARARARLAVDARSCARSSRGTDLGALAQQTERLPRRVPRPATEALVEPQLRAQLGLGFDELRRSDLAAFFRAPGAGRGLPERAARALAHGDAGRAWASTWARSPG